MLPPAILDVRAPFGVRKYRSPDSHAKVHLYFRLENLLFHEHCDPAVDEAGASPLMGTGVQAIVVRHEERATFFFYHIGDATVWEMTSATVGRYVRCYTHAL